MASGDATSHRAAVDDGDLQLYQGDAEAVLASLGAGSVQTCVTSPPYWGLRDYGADEQIGLETDPDDYVYRLVCVFDEVRRVLRDDGTLWLNLGDSYANDAKWGGSSAGGKAVGMVGSEGFRQRRTTGLKPKDLVGIPWRVAFALQKAGWTLRSDIIWAKPNPMPESVTDRPTKAHEYLFLLAKSQRYYYDAAAIREDSIGRAAGNGFVREHRLSYGDRGDPQPWRPQSQRAVELAKARGLTDEHIAAIRASGITDTGKATVTQNGTGKNTDEVKRLAAEAKAALGGYWREFLIPDGRNKRSVWEIPTMPFPDAHFATFPEALVRPCVLAGSRPGDVVLDPFVGSGTTALVARKHGRRCVGIDLSAEYLAIAAKRTQQLSLLGGVA